MTNKKTAIHFTLLTFCIAYFVAGILIILGRFGYTVYNWVDDLRQFAMNIPFAIYILSPAISSYLILKKDGNIKGLKEWLQTVFYFKNKVSVYFIVIAGLAVYFGVHIAVSGKMVIVLPFYTFFLSLPGSLMIGGLEEAGWMYILQPSLDKKYGFVLSSLFFGFIWTLWHIPLFFIPGTNHGEGYINFWMFTIQLISFRFFHGAIYRIAGKGRVFMSILFHTMFNAVSPIFGNMTMTWPGTIAANAVLILFSIIIVFLYDKKEANPMNKKY